MISFSIAKVVISGTFRRNPDSLQKLYDELLGTSCQVLSPRSIEFDGDVFVRSKGEKTLPVKTIKTIISQPYVRQILCGCIAPRVMSA